jgi:hypothetical protein
MGTNVLCAASGFGALDVTLAVGAFAHGTVKEFDSDKESRHIDK